MESGNGRTCLMTRDVICSMTQYFYLPVYAGFAAAALQKKFFGWRACRYGQ